MANVLVSGYGSDSDSDDLSSKSTGASAAGKAHTIPNEAPSLFTSRPPPTATNGTAARLGLPALKATTNASTSSAPNCDKTTIVPKSLAGSKRGRDRLQIKVDSLKAVDNAEGEIDGMVSDLASAAADDSKMSGPASKPSHALFGLLPAPKRTEAGRSVQKGIEREEGKISPSIGHNEAEKDEAAEPAHKKVKGNSDFRAMLGLKPSSQPTKSKPKSERGASAADGDGNGNGMASQTQASVAYKASSAPIGSSVPVPAVIQADFFSLQPDIGSSSRQSDNSCSQSDTFTAVPKAEFQLPSLQIQSAPTDEVDPYVGWQQDPDGSWIPVTPEAWEIYRAHIVAAVPETASKPRRGDISAKSDLAAAGLSEDSLDSVDADVTARAWALRSGNEGKSLPPQGSLGVASGLSNPKDKSSKLRAKGQLSALIAHANENREDLEKKWSIAKSRKAQAGARYGF